MAAPREPRRAPTERPDELPVPESHLEVAEARLADLRRDPTRARPAHEILDRLAEKRK